MIIACRKKGFPVECPKCGRRSGRPNGTRQSRARGPRQQVRCANCKHQWPLLANDLDLLFHGEPIHVDAERLLKGFGIVVIGAPMRFIKRWLGIKGETVRTRLVSLIRAGKAEALDAFLGERFGIPERRRSEFQGAVVALLEFEPSVFRCWSKEWRRRSGPERAADLRLIGRVLGRKVKAAELMGH
jgi:hypothetical protein